MARLVVIALTMAVLAIPVAVGPASAAAPTCNGLAATMVGTNIADVIVGTSTRDVIVARAGADVIRGRGGNDVICGGDGNDVLRGGAGNDTLIGDDGKDGCYPGSGGGTLSTCEGADLRVSVTGPAQAGVGEQFDFTVNLKNIGGKPASDVVLTVTFSQQAADCGIDHSEVVPVGTLEVGEFIEGLYWQRCEPLGDPSSVSLEAEVTSSSADPDPANDEDQSTTSIIDL